jgi:ribonuclease-3
MKSDLEYLSYGELAEALGGDGAGASLLKQALTHSSYAKEHPEAGGKDNERLEFLGDAVLKLIVSDELIRRFPNHDEGRLSKIRAYAVSEEALAGAARRFGLEQRLLLGKGAEKTGERHRDSVLADAMEAIIAAVYLVGGLVEARKLVLATLDSAICSPSTASAAANYKEKLQEYLQQNGAPSPDYEVVDTSGPDHDRQFTVAVTHQGKTLGTGKGKSKKAASQLAARAALIALGIAEDE